MRNDWKPTFKCTFKVLYPNNHYDIYELWFRATTREAARKHAKRYLKKKYINNFKILSINY